MLNFLSYSIASATARVPDWSSRDSMKLITWIGLLIVAVAAGGILLMYLRRRMNDRESGIHAPGSLMDELRRMRREGLLSEAEYEASRRAAVAKLAADMSAPKPGASGQSAQRVPRAAPVKAPVPPRRCVEPRSARLARPGFDLTGEPLPKPVDDGN